MILPITHVVVRTVSVIFAVVVVVVAFIAAAVVVADISTVALMAGTYNILLHRQR